jgi:hypothetical protein
MNVHRPLALVLLVLIVGCGAKAHQPTLRLVKNGQPFRPEEDKGEQMNVTLYPEGGGNESYLAGPLEPDEGLFQIRGPQNKGIPPGRYKVAIEKIQMPIPGKVSKPSSGPPKDLMKDLLGGRYSRDKTTLTCEITGKEEEIKVEVK